MKNFMEIYLLIMGKNDNVYDEKVALQLEQIIEQIGDIFSVIIPDSKLYLQRKL